MITNQRKLYSQVDSHSFVNVDIKEEPNEVNENGPDSNFVELSAVKTESDEDVCPEDLEEQFELIVETPVAKEKPKSTNRKGRIDSGAKKTCKYCSKLMLKRDLNAHVSLLQPTNLDHSLTFIILGKTSRKQAKQHFSAVRPVQLQNKW